MIRVLKYFPMEATRALHFINGPTFSAKQAKVLFLDNRYIVTAGFEQIIHEYFNGRISVMPMTGPFSSEKLKSCAKFDMVIIGNVAEDIVSLIQRIKKTGNSSRVAIFAATLRYDEAMCFLMAGADGYLAQNANSEEIARAIGSVLNNQRYLCKELLEAMAQETLELRMLQRKIPYTRLTSVPYNLIDTLSKRQKQIASGLLRGESDSFIATQFGISTSTVGTHKALAFQKLGVKSIMELMEKYYSDLNSNK